MKILISNIYNPYNLGDRAILEGVEKIIKNKYTDLNVEIFYSTRFTDEFSKFRNNTLKDFFHIDYKNDSISRFLANTLLRLIMLLLNKFFQINFDKTEEFKAFDEIYIIGGNFLYSSRKRFSRTMIIHCLNIMAYSTFSKTIVMPQSLGPFKNKLDKFIVKKSLNKASIVYVRDKKSKDFYKKAKLVPDAAFFLKDNINISKKKTKKIVIALANWKWAKYQHFDVIEKNYNAYLNEHIKLINSLIENCWDVDICVQVRVEACDDKKAYDQIKPHIGAHNFLDLSKLSVSEVINYFGTFSVLLGTRMHSVILGMVSGCKTINVYYQPKGKDLYEWIGLEDFSFDCDKVKYNELKKAIFKLNDEKYIDKFQNAASILEQHKDII